MVVRVTRVSRGAGFDQIDLQYVSDRLMTLSPQRPGGLDRGAEDVRGQERRLGQSSHSRCLLLPLRLMFICFTSFKGASTLQIFISFFQTASLNWRFWWVGWFGGGEASSGSREMTSTTKAGGSGLRPATRRFVRSCLFIKGWN